MSKAYTSHTDGESGDGDWTYWIRPDAPVHKISCCDCGLVHEFEFRIVDGKVEFRARRNERSTGQKRRWMKQKSSSKP